jgi:hypothetical protein
VLVERKTFAQEFIEPDPFDKFLSPWDSRSSVLRTSINLSLDHRSLCHCLIFGCLITLEIMYLLIVFLPLLGSSVAGFFGRFLGSEGTAIMTTTCVSFSSILSLIAFYEVAPGASACYLRIAPWISSEMFDASWGFFGDREVTG